MTPDSQRIAIAKACGKNVRGWRFFWRRHDSIEWIESPTYGDEAHCREWAEKEGRWSEIGTVEEFDAPDMCPNYLGSLDAIAEAEKVLTHQQEFVYHDWLMKLSLKTNRHSCYEACRAKAALRAEAFLRTLSLWEESTT